MFYATGVFAWGKAAVQGNEVEQKLANLLFDESVQVITSFQLNQIASLTYHDTSRVNGEDMSGLILETLEAVLSKPAEHSPLALHKALAVLKHVLIFGAEKVLTSVVYLGNFVRELLEYNSVLIAQKQQGLTGMLYQIKGGGVDKGGPVREAAKAVYQLMTNRDQLQFERSTQADPNSLVPIGSQKMAAFVTDEARLHILKQRMEHQQRMEIRSNLAKADNGFGSGYNSRDGKAYVGAAHGIDEMIKLAKQKEAKAKQQFSDEPGAAAANNNPKTEGYDWNEYSEYAAPQYQAHPPLGAGAAAGGGGVGGNYYPSAPQSYTPQADLLSMHDAPRYQTTAANQEVDLLGFDTGAGGNSSGNSQATTSNYQAEMDLLGMSSIPAHAPSASVTADLLAVMDINKDPRPPPTAWMAYSSNPPPLLSAIDPSLVVSSGGNKSNAKPIMGGSSVDRFAALDSLVSTVPKHTSSTTTPISNLSTFQAENRILGNAGLVAGNSGLRLANAFSPTPTNSLSNLDALSWGQQKLQDPIVQAQPHLFSLTAQQQQHPAQTITSLPTAPAMVRDEPLLDTSKLAPLMITSLQQAPWSLSGGTAGVSGNHDDPDLSHNSDDDGGFGGAMGMGGPIGSGIPPPPPMPPPPPPDFAYDHHPPPPPSPYY